MRWVEKHFIKKGHRFFAEIDNICFRSKNLYNAALYAVRQHYFATGEYLNYYAVQKTLQNTVNPDYYALPAKVSQQVLKGLDKNFVSFFAAMEEYKDEPSKFKARPKLPGYKEKQTGRNVTVYTIQAISSALLRKNKVKLSKTNIIMPWHKPGIKQARIVPVSKNVYKIEIVYEQETPPKQLDASIVAGIDIGLNNLAAITSNLKGFQPVLINGRPLKSINQYFNKERSILMSYVGDKGTSNRIEKLTHKRNCMVDNYLHRSSRFIINMLIENNVGTLIIGKNDGWKDNINIGKRNNQNFVCIPFTDLIHQLAYKGEMAGMAVITREESYTSKCSFLDEEPIEKHEKYLGRRVKRGLFKSQNGTKINADVNGSGNIIRKELPNAFAKGIEGMVVFPKRITPFKVKSKQMSHLSMV